MKSVDSRDCELPPDGPPRQEVADGAVGGVVEVLLEVPLHGEVGHQGLGLILAQATASPARQLQVGGATTLYSRRNQFTNLGTYPVLFTELCT